MKLTDPNSVHPAQRSQGGMQHFRPKDGQEEPCQEVWLLLRLWKVVEGVAAWCQMDEHGLRPGDDANDNMAFWSGFRHVFFQFLFGCSSSKRVRG